MNPPLKKIFTLKKIVRKPKKKKQKKEETPPNSQEFSPIKSSPLVTFPFKKTFFITQIALRISDALNQRKSLSN
jgi:hypothetical protein